jgi:ribosomal protein L37AE/L43A
MPIINKPDPTLKNNLMSFGFECEKGWYPLICELLRKLNELPEEIYLLQVKEKYAGLRVYISSQTEIPEDIIRKYEILASHVCEHCGEFYTAKERNKNHWYKTLCDKCNKRWQDGTLWESKLNKFVRLSIWKFKNRKLKRSLK